MRMQISSFLLMLCIVANAQTESTHKVNATIKRDSIQIADSLKKLAIFKEDSLGEFVVKARKPILQYDANSLTVNVEKSYLENLGKVVDILKRIPGMSESGLSLADGGSPTFLINGREVKNNKELEILKSSDIKKIVVDRDPTAKYSSEKTGVVYITTKSKIEDHLSLEVSDKFSFSKKSRNSAGFSISEKYKKVSNYLSIDFNYRDVWAKSWDKTTIYNESDTINNSVEQQWNGYHKSLDAFYMLNYDIAKNHTLGVQYTGQFFHLYRPNGFVQTINGNEMLYVKNHLYSECLNTVNINYRWQIDKKRSLEYSTDYTTYNTPTSTETTSEPPTNIHGKDRYDVFGGRIDYNSGIKWADVSAGASISAVRDKSHNIYDGDRTDIKVKDHIYAVYVSARKKISDFEIKAGIRAEWDKRNLNSTESGTFYDSTEFRIIPSFSLSKKIDNKTSVGLTLSQTVSRPSYSQLTPQMSYHDAISYGIGNPNLSPSVTTQITSYVSSGSFYASLAYRQRNDNAMCIPHWNETGATDRKIVWEWENYDKMRYLVGFASYTIKLGVFRANLSAFINQPFVHITYLDERVSLKKPFYYVMCNGSVAVGENGTFTFNAFYNGKGNSFLDEISAAGHLDIGYMHYFMKKRLCLYASIDDILNTNNRSHSTMRYANIETRKKSKNEFPLFSVSLRYTFGNIKLNTRKKTANSDVINRIK